jgi:hypothetical protein
VRLDFVSGGAKLFDRHRADIFQQQNLQVPSVEPGGNRKTPTFRINSKWELWLESCGSRTTLCGRARGF